MNVRIGNYSSDRSDYYCPVCETAFNKDSKPKLCPDCSPNPWTDKCNACENKEVECHCSDCTCAACEAIKFDGRKYVDAVHKDGVTDEVAARLNDLDRWGY